MFYIHLFSTHFCRSYKERKQTCVAVKFLALRHEKRTGNKYVQYSIKQYASSANSVCQLTFVHMYQRKNRQEAVKILEPSGWISVIFEDEVNSCRMLALVLHEAM